MARLSAKALAEPVGEGLELLGRFARLVEELRHVLHVLGRDAEQALEGVDLGADHRPVALGQLGRQHHHRDGEELLLRAEHGGEVGGVRSQPGPQRARIRRVAHGGAHHGADRPTRREAGDAADDLAPEAQAAISPTRRTTRVGAWREGGIWDFSGRSGRVVSGTRSPPRWTKPCPRWRLRRPAGRCD
jgi:hypothetical protein